MKNSKGFTLIELLGVIILLGLIVAIIVPKASSSIEKAKQNSAADNALAYVKATRDYYNASVLDTDFVLISGKNYVKNIDSYIEVKGVRPLSGYLTISDDKIVYAKLCINYYDVVYENSNVTVAGTCTGEEQVSQYTSYTAGAAKAYIYTAPGYFNVESDLFINPPISTLIIYVDSLDKVISAHWGYVFDTVETVTVENYVTTLNELISLESPSTPLESCLETSHYYVLEELSIIYLLEYNTYMSALSQPIIDYSVPLATVLDNLKLTFFGGNISTTVYKTLEF